jgi:hypothetical protein
MFVRMPSSVRARQALRPSTVLGSLTTMFGCDLGPLPAFLDHGLELDIDHLGGNRAVDDLADFGKALAVIDALLGDERGVGGHAVEHTHLVGLLDLVQIRRVDVNLHCRLLMGDGESTRCALG